MTDSDIPGSLKNAAAHGNLPAVFRADRCCGKRSAAADGK